MDNVPPRPPQGNESEVRAYQAQFFGPAVISGLAVLSLLLGGLGGFALALVFKSIYLLAWMLAGAVVGVVAFQIALKKWIKAKDAGLDMVHLDRERAREDEFQRKLETARANGELDRWETKK